MKRIVAFAVALLALLTLTVAPSSAAPATTLATTSSVVVVKENGRSFAARVIQPTGSAPGAYPVVVFGHGFAQSSARYTSTLTSWAQRGYVVVAPDSQVGLLPSHSAFADDLVAAAAWAHRTQPNAALATVLAGHSMGGGAAVLAAARTTGVTGLVLLAPAETRPSAVAAAAGVTAPSLTVVGSKDTIVPSSQSLSIAHAFAGPDSQYVVDGGFHCGFVDSSSFFGLGCDKGSITRAQQLATTQSVTGDWLDANG